MGLLTEEDSVNIVKALLRNAEKEVEEDIIVDFIHWIEQSLLRGAIAELVIKGEILVFISDDVNKKGEDRWLLRKK